MEHKWGLAASIGLCGRLRVLADDFNGHPVNERVQAEPGMQVRLVRAACNRRVRLDRPHCVAAGGGRHPSPADHPGPALCVIALQPERSGKLSYCPELHLHASHVHALVKLARPVLSDGTL